MCVYGPDERGVARPIQGVATMARLSLGSEGGLIGTEMAGDCLPA